MGTQTLTVRPDAAPSAANRPRLGQLIYDLITLFELQAKLVRIDAQRSMRRAIAGAVCVTIASLGVVGALILVLAGAGVWIAEWADWPVSASLAAAGIMAAMISIAVVVAGVALFRSIRETFQPSTDELQKNLNTIKNSLINE